MANSPHAPPIGEDAWLALIEEESRVKGRDISSRIDILERHKQAVNAEHGSIKAWIAYCEFFWSLYTECNSYTPGRSTLSPEEKMMGCEVFSLDAALSLWQQAYEATRYRLSDSHELWNRWIALEMELLSSSRTPQGVQRITHLFKNRLQTPHMTWAETSQMFSTFLSEYHKAEYEATMLDVMSSSQEARQMRDDRDAFETKLTKARVHGEVEEEKLVMRHYLDWEMKQNKTKNPHRQRLLIETCLGLYSRALTGILSRDDSVWTDYVVWISSLYTVFSTGRSQVADPARLLPNLLDTLQRAVSHCPWAGTLWARYILGAEEAGLSYDNVERIKHAATASSQLDRDGMTSVIDLYAAWCGFLKRRAMNANATDEDADVAEIGLTAALEDVQVWGKRLYGNEYRGDPNFRLERILIQYLTEKKATVDDARKYWDESAKRPIYADSYNFWLLFYAWEMAVFQNYKGSDGRSPTPATTLASRSLLRIPSLATNVLARGVRRPSLDWPEKVMEVYLQHCNEYEPPEVVRRANDTVHKGLKAINKRRQEEQAAAYSAQVAQYQQGADARRGKEASAQDADETSRKKKRAREDESGDLSDGFSKRVKKESEADQQQGLKRDRENTSVYVSHLPPPPECSQTKVRQYFREYGHINNMIFKVEEDGRSAVALVEFDTADEAQTALLRNGKYFGQQQISVTSAAGTNVYVTNYPPHADEGYICNLFKDCGVVFSVRWPSLKANTHRRFCYVSFRDAEGAAKATRLDGKRLDGKYCLVAKYSDPGNRKQREGAVEEGREVHVTGLPQEATEGEVKALFEKYGTVERVRVLTNQSGRSRGTAFVVFKTKEQADSVVAELDKTKFSKHILRLEKSVPKTFKPGSKTDLLTSSAPATSGGAKAKDGDGGQATLKNDDDTAQNQNKNQDKNKSTLAGTAAERTFALMGLPDTMNDSRVRGLVEGHGQLSRLTLRPDHGGAILEFVDTATAGRAQLSLDGTEVEGRKLRTGSASDLFQEKGQSRMDRIDRMDKKAGPSSMSGKAAKARMAPLSTTIRRPILGSKGKRLLNSEVVINKAVKAEAASSGAAHTSGADGAAPPAKSMKSNADFRALILNCELKGKEEVSSTGVLPTGETKATTADATKTTTDTTTTTTTTTTTVTSPTTSTPGQGDSIGM